MSVVSQNAGSRLAVLLAASIIIPACLVGGALTFGLRLDSGTASAQSVNDPNPAVNNPDKFAWDLFIEVNRPALVGRRGVPDPNKKHGDPGPRVWETWKITTENGNEVFLDNGRNPGPWETPQAKDAKGNLRKFLSPPKMRTIKFGFVDRGPSFEVTKAPPLDRDSQEARINQVGYEFIVKEGLYSLDGQERFRATQRKVEFPIGTINVKAHWREFTLEEIKGGVPARYYTAEDSGKVWGLTGFHMTSKDLPNWFWATFEHAENPPPEIRDRDRYTKLRDPSGRLREVPDPLKNTYWQYYVLRGTQVDFVDSTGSPTILGNTQLEGGMQVTSSCMGCHARSTIGDRMDNIIVNGRRLYPNGAYFFPSGKLTRIRKQPEAAANRLTVNPVQVVLWREDPQKPEDPEKPDLTKVVHVMGAIGAPNPEWFIDSAGQRRYTQLDFIWGFLHAQRENP
ncbi:MAG: hypothetical protein HY727_21705 [Candidatus Rokubacteria bacterium]|nr:hypothetical protein [Candidatus Rokubacteria bacterium]